MTGDQQRGTIRAMKTAAPNTIRIALELEMKPEAVAILDLLCADQHSREEYLTIATEVGLATLLETMCRMQNDVLAQQAVNPSSNFHKAGERVFGIELADEQPPDKKTH